MHELSKPIFYRNKKKKMKKTNNKKKTKTKKKKKKKKTNKKKKTKKNMSLASAEFGQRVEKVKQIKKKKSLCRPGEDTDSKRLSFKQRKM